MAETDEEEECPNALAKLPPKRGNEPYLLPWGDKYYHVLKKDVVSYAKSTNAIASAQELGKVLASINDDDWFPFLLPEYLMCIKGIEGKQVFTTFNVQNHPNEKRILRMVPAVVCVHCFPMHIEARLPGWRKQEDINDRQKIRAEVLLWRPETDLPARDEGYVLSPIANRWTDAKWTTGSVAIWPGPSILRKAADAIYPVLHEYSDEDSGDDDEGVSSSANYTGARPTTGRLQHVPFAPAPIYEAERMCAAYERVKLACKKMQCIRQDTHEYVVRVLEQNVQAQQAQHRDSAQTWLRNVAHIRSTKDAVRNATDELFEIKDQLSNGSYVEIAKSLKRSWDCAV